MLSVDHAIAKLEEISGHDIQQRNIGPLVAFVRGHLAAAALSIATHSRPNVAIITGFYLCHGEPPNCETDGPPGAAMLAAGLKSVGIPCRVVTDWLNARVVRATLAGGGLSDVPVDIVGAESDGGLPLDVVRTDWLAASPPITHVIAIERCGPDSDGHSRTALGDDISNYHAPLERLFLGGPWTRIGIGDLGNELGMGSLPRELVAVSITNGGQIWCPIAADHTIVAGVSNLAAAALLGAIALLRPAWAPSLLDRLTPDFNLRLLEAAVRDGGAVSGARNGKPPRPELAVDGIPWPILEGVYAVIHQVSSATLHRYEHERIVACPAS